MKIIIVINRACACVRKSVENDNFVGSGGRRGWGGGGCIMTLRNLILLMLG